MTTARMFYPVSYAASACVLNILNFLWCKEHDDLSMLRIASALTFCIQAELYMVVSLIKKMVLPMAAV